MAPSRPSSPPGHMLVLNSNLQEAFLEDDRADPSDVANFGRRVAEVVPYVPDVVLLQEVVGSSARRAADALTDEFGTEYTVAVAPGRSAHRSGPSDREEVLRETAILLNATTMRAASRGGFVATRYAPRDSNGSPVHAKEHAHVAAQDLRNGGHVVLLCVHLVTRQWLASKEVANSYRARWASQLAVFLAETYMRQPPPVTRIIGGDFNSHRCDADVESVDCEPLPFWSVLHGLGYRDAVFHVGRPGEIGTQKRIDYVFTDAPPVDAASDLSYGAEDRQDPARRYSDHRLIWTVLAVSR